jgi:phosphatidylcholine synthase
MTNAKVFAWLVHLYTAMGLVCAAGIAVLIVRGGDRSFRLAFMLMLIATAIDATDGWLATKARVKQVLPHFSGRALDDVIDFQTYAALPLLLLWRADVLPGASAWLLLLPLLASAYGFAQVNAKTGDGFFLGFPSYWNIVAFYLYFLQPPVWFAAAVIATLTVLTFVPTRYIYATQGGPFSKTVNVGALAWGAAIVWILMDSERDLRSLATASLIFPAVYLTLSAIMTARTR